MIPFDLSKWSVFKCGLYTAYPELDWYIVTVVVPLPDYPYYRAGQAIWMPDGDLFVLVQP